MRAEVSPTGLGGIDALDEGVLVNGSLGSFNDVGDIVGCPVDVALNIHGETRGLGDGETEVKRNNTGNAAKTDEDTPHEVNTLKTLLAGGGKSNISGADDAILVC